MDFKNFSSDSTYFSLCENVTEKRKQRTNNRMSDLKFLDIVHNEVIHHLEGKELIARAKVVQYMKRISRIKLKTPKDRYFVEKIQSLLHKIYNLTKQFEKSLSIGNLSATLDFTGNCSLTDDFQIINADNDNPKQILLKTTSVNDESSFPLELLTNVNFISSSQQNIHTPINELSIKEKENIKGSEIIEPKSSHESNNLNTFFTENSEVYLKSNSSLSFMEDIIDTQHIPDAENLNQDKTVHSTNNFVVKDIQNNENLQSEDDTMEHFSTMESLKNVIRKGECDPLLEISKLCTNLSLKLNSMTTIPKTLNDNLPTNVTTWNIRSITDLGNLFNEYYNAEIYKLYNGTGGKLGNSDIWLKMESDFINMQHSAKDVHHILDEQLEKLHIEEFNTKEIQHLQLEKKDIHNFNEEDKRKLDIEDLISMNKERLEEISEEFKTYLNTKQ